MAMTERFEKLFLCVVIAGVLWTSALCIIDTSIRDVIIPSNDHIPLVNGATLQSGVDVAYITTDGGILYDFTTNSPPI
jgi:hypothetical protein